MFDYNVMTEEEAMNERYKLLKTGEYDAVVSNAYHKTSTAGNDMIVLELSCYDNNGAIHYLKDFLVFTPKMMWKTIHCADSANLSKEYKEKKFCPELINGKNIRVMIATKNGDEIPMEKLNGKEPGSCYPNKNIVTDYIKSSGSKNIESAIIQNEKPNAISIDEDVPF